MVHVLIRSGRTDSTATRVRAQVLGGSEARARPRAVACVARARVACRQCGWWLAVAGWLLVQLARCTVPYTGL